MKVCMIGTGYVGLVSGACLAEMGNDVICVDKNQGRIAALLKGEIPFFEPGLEEIVESNSREGRLEFSTDLAEAVRQATICFIAVGTPGQPDGSADLSAVFQVAQKVAQAMNGFRIIATKSTVPVGTAARIQALVSEQTEHPFSVVSNPEFLKQGSAVNDFLKPERVIVGADDSRAFDLMQELYAPFLRTGNPIISMDVASAEMTKYVANAFLATKISFINEMSRLCESVGADIELVRAGICTDSRIGRHFLFPGIGFGGSCLPKDVKALLRTGHEAGCDLPLIAAAREGNDRQKEFFISKILTHFSGGLQGKSVALWGLSFKPKTDDLREAPSLDVVQALTDAGAQIRAFDPQAMEKAAQLLPDTVTLCRSSYEACDGCEALVVLTEWNEFRRPDYERIKQRLNQPIIFDGRNLYSPERMAERGFHYHCVGRVPTVPSSESERAPAPQAGSR